MAFVVDQRDLREQTETIQATYGDKEVDFVVQKGNAYIGLEVKSNNDKTTEGMQEFRKRFRPEAMFVVGEADYPLEEFFSHPVISLFK